MATKTSPSVLSRYDWSAPVDAAARPWAQVFDHVRFYARIVRNLPQGLKYRREITNLISDITIGAGALVVGGGMFFVIFAMSFFTGTEVGLQGFKALEQIGTAAYTGVISSVANTREITPLIAGVALAAQVGAGFTAQLGAMRISDEIDALEVMGVDSFQYLVATRV
ncbi:MAG: ABC transporter permease, partial [Acidimicrobiales bacterium]